MAVWPASVSDYHTGLFMKRGSKLVPYQRPEKYPLSKERHRLLKDNAYSEQRSSCKTGQPLEPSCIEPWLDREVALYDLPRPGHSVQQPTGRKMDTPNVSMASFPEDLDATFNSGSLDSIFTITGAGTHDERVVPDHSHVTMEYNAVQNESLYNTTNDHTKALLEDGQPSLKGLEAPTRQQDLPVLFYPRTCTKPPPSKRTKSIKIPKFLKRSRPK